MAARARSLGVPAECVLIGTRATDTGENIAIFAGASLKNGKDAAVGNGGAKPYLDRRTQAAMDV